MPEHPSRIRVLVDSDLCAGHGRCYSVSPELFHPDDAGYCEERGGTFEAEVDQRPQAELAAASCPEGAISVTIATTAPSVDD